MYKSFLKQHASIIHFLQRLLDLAVILICGISAFYFSNAVEHVSGDNFTGLPTNYLFVILLSLVLSTFLFSVFSVYRVWRGSSTLSQIKNLTMMWIALGLSLAVLAFITKTGADYSRSWMGIWFLSAWAFMLGVRVVWRMALHWLRSNGYNHRHIVIVGTGDQAVVVAERLRKSAWFGLEISALFGDKNNALPDWLKDKKLILDVVELRQYIDSGNVDQVWIALPHSKERTIREVIAALDGSVAEIRYVPDIFEYQLMNHSLSEIAGVPVVNISYSAIDGMNQFIKNIEDYMLATLLLILSTPLMLLIAVGVKLSSPGPILYKQCRVGWNGLEFTMLKFRSMPVEAETESGPVWANKTDNRATAFGSFLRKTSLDELPQLLNVLKGEMSLIGPRPERPMFVEKYKEEVPHYMKKHLVKAGLTGWAQVHGWRGNTCLHTRIEHDLYYIENWSLWLDIKIFIMTVFRGFLNKNAY